MSNYFDNGGYVGASANFAAPFQSIVTNGLQLYLDASDPNSYPGSGTTWTNLANPSLNATLSGTTFTTAAGGGIVFGNGNTATIPSGLTFSGTGTGYTISIWLRHTGTVSTARIQRYFTLGPEAAVLRHNNATNSNLNAYSIDSGATIRGVDVDGQIFTGNYYNVVSIFNGSAFFVYNNGILVNATAISFTLRSPTTALLSNATEYFEGSMHAVQYYNRPLSFNEVGRNYNALRRRFGL